MISPDVPVADRFQFTARAEPFRLGGSEPHVYGYTWRPQRRGRR